MSEKKLSIWTRIRHLVFGRPVTHEEQQAARRSVRGDTMTRVQNSVRGANSAGFHL